jgi:two-component system response regulator DctR
LIVEDDATIASVYQRTIAAIEHLEVAGVVARGEDALAFINRRQCDLMLLDLRLSGMNGLTLLHKLRAGGHPVEVIAVTSTRSAGAVRALAQRGAIDYLIKPFTVDRLRQSLALFFSRASALRKQDLDQADIDRICASGRSAGRWLPKGLTDEGVARIRQALADERECTSGQLADATGMARVTARRYLEYLVASGQASVDAVANGPGRPRKLYSPLF